MQKYKIVVLHLFTLFKKPSIEEPLNKNRKLSESIEYKITYPTWSVHIYRSFDQPKGEDDLGFGIKNNEQVTFEGDGDDFKKWLLDNWKEMHEEYEKTS